MGITPITDAAGLMDQLTMPGVNPVQNQGSGSDFKTIWSDQAAGTVSKADKLSTYVQKENTGSDTRRDVNADDRNVKAVADNKSKDIEASKTDVRGMESPDKAGDTKAADNAETGGVLKDENIETAQETLASIIESLMQKITEILGKDPEEIENILQAEGIDKMQLLDGDVLASVLVKALGADSRLSLLTDEAGCNLFNECMTTLGDVLGTDSGFEDLTVGQLKDLVSEALSGKEETVPLENTDDFGDVVIDVSDKEETKPETVRYERDSNGNFIRTNIGENGKETGEATVVTEASKPENRSKDFGEKKNNDSNSHMMQGNSQLAEIKPEAPVQVQDTAFSYATNVNEIAEQILERMKTVTDGDYSDVEMQLHPASLGTLHIHVTNNAGVLTASFVTENEAVRSAVESQMVRLIEQFETQGIKVDAVEVTVASHAFEQGNDAGRSNESNEGNQKRSRRINLGDLEGDLVTDDMEEDEKIAAEMMAANGNTVDFTA